MITDIVHAIVFKSYLLGLASSLILMIFIFPVFSKIFIKYYIKKKINNCSNNFLSKVMIDVKNKSDMFGGILSNVLPGDKK